MCVTGVRGRVERETIQQRNIVGVDAIAERRTTFGAERAQWTGVLRGKSVKPLVLASALPIANIMSRS